MKKRSPLLILFFLILISFALFGFQREPFILNPSAIPLEGYETLKSTIQKFNSTPPYLIWRNNQVDSVELYIQKALAFYLDSFSDLEFEAEIRQALGFVYENKGKDYQSEKEYRKAVDLFLKAGINTKAVLAANRLIYHYNERLDSTILKMGPVCRQTIQMFKELSDDERNQLAQVEKALLFYLEVANSYESLDRDTIQSLRSKYKRALNLSEKAVTFKYKSGLNDSVYVYTKQILELYEGIIMYVDDPTIWRYYLGYREEFSDYLKSQETLGGGSLRQDSSISYLQETLSLANEHLAKHDSWVIPIIQCKLYERLMEKSPVDALGLIESRSTAWQCMQATSSLYHTLGDHQKAILLDQNRYDRMRSMRDQTLASQDLARSYLAGRYYEEAEHYIRRAMQNLPDFRDKTHSRRILAPFELAAALAGQDRLAEALPLVIEVETMLMKQKGSITNGATRDIYAEHANILAKMGDFDSAKSYLNKAFLYAASETNVAATNKLRLLAARIHLWSKDYPTALDSAKTLIAYLRPNKVSIDQVSFPKDLLRAYKLEGDILFEHFKEKNDLNLLSQAYQSFKEAIEIVDWIRQSYYAEGSKLFLQQEAKPIFNDAILVSLHLHQMTDKKSYIEEAFRFLENKKGVLLLESVQRAKDQKTIGISSGLLQKERRAKLALDYYQKEIFLAKQKTEKEEQLVKVRLLESKALRYQKSYDSLMLVLKQEYPRYYQLNYGVKTATVRDIQTGLQSSNSAMINYSLHNNKIYAFVFTGQAYQIIEIPLIENLPNKIQQLQKAAFSPFILKDLTLEQRKAYNDTLIQNAHLLYQQLFAPIIAQIDLPEKIIISPDGPIGYLPFELLLQELPKDFSNFGSHQYLIRDFQISYTYSGTLLLEMQAKKYAAGQKSLLAFAPLFKDTVADTINQSLASIRSGLRKLDFNVPEVEGIKSLLGGTTFIGIEATEEQFCSEAHNYQIIHLSTHGKVNVEEGKFSYLAFTEVEDSLENEFLYNQDLYHLDLNADMVVLSACETGIGQLHEGEGIMSLARGFSYAGAKSIITSLWSVNDATTKELMEQFYTYIKAGKSKDYALRQAKLDFIDKHVNEAHPFFWAPFIAIGDMEPIKLNTGIKFFYWALGILFISLLYWKVRKHLNNEVT